MRRRQAAAMRLTSMVAAVAAAVALGGVALPAPAAPGGFVDFPGGLTLLVEQWAGADHPGTYKTAYSGRTVVKDMLDRAWTSAAPGYCSAITSWLNTPNRFGNGITLYDDSSGNRRPPLCRMGSAGSLSIQDNLASRRVVVLDYDVRGNWLQFKSTVPGPSPAGLDPKFSVTYDLEATMALHVGDAVAITVESATVHVRNALVQPENAWAGLASLISGIFSGGGITGQMESQMDATTVDFTTQLRKQLVPVGALLDRFAKQGYRELTGRLERGALALYISGKDYQVPTSGAGTITGFIQWKKTDAHPQRNGSPCQALSVQATTQSGYSSRDQQRFAPFTPVGAAQMAANGRDAGDSYRCDYVIKNLPAGVPLIVQVASGPGWITSAGVVVAPRAEQLGWSGTVTIRGSSTVANINFELIFQQAPQ